jgi:hypothetical protein
MRARYRITPEEARGGVEAASRAARQKEAELVEEEADLA